MARDQRDVLVRQVRTVFQLGMIGGLTDGQLLERFTTQSGEAAELAFAALVERHGSMVLRVCRAVLGNAPDADDAFQATFLVLVRRAGSLWVRDSLGPWLYKVARRTASIARTARVRRRRYERKAAEMVDPYASSAGPDDLGEVLHEEIARLPERYQEAIVLCLLEGMTHEQAAQRLRWPVGTVESRLARGREQLRGLLMRRGIAPSAGLLSAPGLLSRHAASAAVPMPLAEATVSASMRLAAYRSVAATEVSAKITLLTEGVLKMMFIAKVKAGLAVLLLVSSLAVVTILPSPLIEAGGKRTPGERSGSVDEPRQAGEPRPTVPQLAHDQPNTTPRETEPPKSDVDKPEAALPFDLVKPRPWQTAVRIKVHRERSVAFFSGTIIASNAKESVILTCAHNFKVDGGKRQDEPSSVPKKLAVDLFGGELDVDAGKSQVRFAGETYMGEVIDLDFQRDVGLVRIRPGRRLLCSAVVPSRWQPTRGVRGMITVGCSLGNDATAWSTSIVNPNVRPLADNDLYEAIECAIAPKQGRTGGGLFTADGHLAGVCNYADPWSDHGLYASPRSIYHLLEKTGLTALCQTAPDDEPAIADTESEGTMRTRESPPQEAAATAQEQRLRGIERKLDQILKALESLKHDKGR